MSTPAHDHAPRTPKVHHPYRGRLRRESHQVAHEEETAPVVIPSDPLIPRGGPAVVKDQAALAELIEHVREVGSFAYDSEFIGEQSYFPKLCLLQVATRDRVALVDPLTPAVDLRPFWELLPDASVEKVVHAGLQDLEPAIRILGRSAANVFDTQIAAAFLGLTYPMGLSKLVEQFIGVHLGKGLKFSQWDQRPLSAVQVRYAADDVRYLPALRARMGQRLVDEGNAAWLAEECASLVDRSLYEFDAARQAQRVRGSEWLDARRLAVLQELAGWRDRAAREQDVPPRTFLKDAVMLELARQPVKHVKQLGRVRGLPWNVEEAWGATIVELTHKALSLPVEALPPVWREPETPQERAEAQGLWAAVQKLGQERGVDATMVASRRDAENAWRQLVETGEVKEGKLSRGWRRELLDTVLEQNRRAGEQGSRGEEIGEQEAGDRREGTRGSSIRR